MALTNKLIKYRNKKLADKVTTCIMCGDPFLKSNLKKHYCSYECRISSYDHYRIIRQMKERFFDPIYQANQLNLFYFEWVRIYKKEVVFNF